MFICEYVHFSAFVPNLSVSAHEEDTGFALNVKNVMLQEMNGGGEVK